MPGLRVRVSGRAAVTAATRRYDKQIAKREVLAYLRYARRIARAGYALQFRTSGSTFGRPWQKLAARTVRGRRGRARRPLIGKGKLRKAVTRAASRISGDRLKMVATTQGKDRRSLIRLHEMGGSHLPVRRIRDPKTGLGGQPLRSLERQWQKIGDRISRRLGGS